MNPLAGTSLEKEEGCLGLQIPRMPKLGLVRRWLWDAFCYHLREFLLQQTSASGAGQKFWLCFFEAVVTTGILYFGLCIAAFAPNLAAHPVVHAVRCLGD